MGNKADAVETIKKARACMVVAFGLVCLLPVTATAKVDCDQDPEAMQRAINTSRPGETIVVGGECRGNFIIPIGTDSITLDGGGTATINGANPDESTLLVRAKGVTIRGFTITGGRDGIEVSRGAWAVIDGNVIQNTGRFGIDVTGVAFAVVVNNMIQNNANSGLALGMNAAAWVGFFSESDTVASPNRLTTNGAQGVVVRRGSFARIVGNEISENNGNGIRVTEAADAQISGNNINGNGRDGILVEQGSGVALGTADTGTNIFNLINRTTVPNRDFGIRCRVGGFTDGRLGQLSGEDGGESVEEGCIDSLIP